MDNLHITIEMITPEKAREYLARNISNRKMKPAIVRKYKNDMIVGRWRFTHQGIAFNKNGDLVDGQHRLQAIIEAGVTIRMLVTRGLDKDSHVGIDDHARRSVYDTLLLSDIDRVVCRDHATVASSCLRIPVENVRMATKQNILEFLDEHYEAIDFVVKCFKTKQRGVTQASVMVPIMRAWYHYEDKIRLKKFMEVLLSGMPSGDGDMAAIKLRNWLLVGEGQLTRHNASRRQVYFKTERAIYSFMEEENLGVLRAAQTELFPLQDESKQATT